ncbi:MAG: hypothetical protein V4689_09685 [Verrucomicrobiota bacterium]
MSSLPSPFKSIAFLSLIALSAGSSMADTVPNPASGDIFIGFRATEGTGASTSYLVKAGTFTQLSAVPAGSSITLASLGDLGADLTGTYGATWHTRGELSWSAFGIGSSSSAILYGSRERSPVSSASAAWPLLTDITRASTHSQINSVLNSIGGYRSSTATANSTVATLQGNFSGAASYSYQVGTAGTSDFGTVSQWSGIEGDFGGGVSGTALDLYRITQTGVNRLGYFTISITGVITYTNPSDSDSDGLVDIWEQQYFGNITAQDGAGDPDGDGQNNSEEQIFGTSPASGSDRFLLTGIGISEAEAGFSFTTIPSRSYQIYFSTGLAAGSWQLIHTIAGGASPATVNYQDTDPERLANTRGFYKVAVVAP